MRGFASPFRASLGLIFALNASLPAQPPGEVPRQDAAAFVKQLVADSQRHAHPRKLQSAHPLRQAEIACAAMAGDVTELGLWQRRVLAAYSAAGHWEEAETLLRTMIGHQALLARVEHAIYAHKARREGDYSQVLAETLKSAEASMDLKREQVLEVCARLAASLEDHATLEKLLPLLGAHDRLAMETASIQDGDKPPPSRSEAARRIEELKPGNAAACRYLLAAARQHFASKSDEAPALLEMAGEKAAEARVLNAARQLLDVARLARANQLPALQDKAAALFERIVTAYADSSEWKPSCLAMLAAYHEETGAHDRARDILARAEEAARRVTIIYAPPAWVEVAAVHHQAGNEAAELRCILQALQVAAALEHPRARGPGDILVCLHYGGTQRELPAEVLPLIEKTRQHP